jgi:hypothetical protein
LHREKWIPGNEIYAFFNFYTHCFFLLDILGEGLGTIGMIGIRYRSKDKMKFSLWNGTLPLQRQKQGYFKGTMHHLLVACWRCFKMLNALSFSMYDFEVKLIVRTDRKAKLDRFYGFARQLLPKKYII